MKHLLIKTVSWRLTGADGEIRIPDFGEQALSLIAMIQLLPASLQALQQVPSTERTAVERWLKGSAYFSAAHGLYEEHWTWLALLPRLERLLATGLVYWWQAEPEPQGLLLLDPGIAEQEADGPLRLSYLDVPATTLPAVTKALRALAATHSLAAVSSRPLATEEVRQAYVTAGWEVKEYELWIFERPLPLDTEATHANEIHNRRNNEQ